MRLIERLNEMRIPASAAMDGGGYVVDARYGSETAKTLEGEGFRVTPCCRRHILVREVESKVEVAPGEDRANSGPHGTVLHRDEVELIADQLVDGEGDPVRFRVAGPITGPFDFSVGDQIGSMIETIRRADRQEIVGVLRDAGFSEAADYIESEGWK